MKHDLKESSLLLFEEGYIFGYIVDHASYSSFNDSSRHLGHEYTTARWMPPTADRWKYVGYKKYDICMQSTSYVPCTVWNL